MNITYYYCLYILVGKQVFDFVFFLPESLCLNNKLKQGFEYAPSCMKQEEVPSANWRAAWKASAVKLHLALPAPELLPAVSKMRSTT